MRKERREVEGVSMPTLACRLEGRAILSLGLQVICMLIYQELGDSNHSIIYVPHRSRMCNNLVVCVCPVGLLSLN
jgi:hypothetical protein